VPHSDEDLQAMLTAVGVSSIDELFDDIPEEVRLRAGLDLPAALAESELVTALETLAARNTPATKAISFLGAGAYDHYVPAVVDAITGRSEFYTAYTPYQPERSQGVLQAIFEYQTAICELTGLEVSNASLYDGATALAEAAFMAHAETKRTKIVVSETVHPEYRQVLATETRGLGLEIVEVARDGGGLTDTAALARAVDEQTAAVALQHPNIFGGLEDMEAAALAAHAAGALSIAVVDPLSLGVLRPPGEYDADIAVGEGQAMGNYLNFGGPYLGFMGARERLLRRMPGRIVGETVDVEGKRGFVLTLQTREQHIRRERATSNICSNQALNALAALVYLSWLGRAGLPELGELCARKADYLRGRLLELPGVEPFTGGPVFREFAVRLPLPASEAVAALAPAGFLAGVSAGRWWPELEDVLLVAVTERRTREQMDAFVAELRRFLASRSGAATASDGPTQAPGSDDAQETPGRKDPREAPRG
jgi:glycine dehydrogenase subunit 1